MTVRIKITLSIILNIVFTLLATLGIQAVLVLLPRTTLPVTWHYPLLSTPLPEIRQELMIPMIQIVESNKLFIFFLFTTYLIIIFIIPKITYKIIPTKEAHGDWIFKMNLITSTTILTCLTIPVIIFEILGASIAQPQMIIKVIGCYVIIYLLYLGYNLHKNKHRLKGIKKEEVFQ